MCTQYESNELTRNLGGCHNCMINCLNTRIRRFLIPLVFLFPITLAPQFSGIFNYIYFPIVSGSAGFIIFWNYPFLVYMTASKPLYYEDLFIDEGKLPNYNINPSVKDKFQCILLWVLIFTNSLLVAALSDYWLYKTENHDEPLQVIGITGGIIKIFQIVNNTIGRGMLKIIKREIVTENLKMEELERRSIANIVQLKEIVESQKTMELTERNRNFIISVTEKN